MNQIRFLDRKSRTRNVSCEYREPITRRPVKLSRFAEKLLASDERLEDDVAQIRAPVHDTAERVVRHRVDFTIGLGDGGDDRRTAREL